MKTIFFGRLKKSTDNNIILDNEFLVREYYLFEVHLREIIGQLNPTYFEWYLASNLFLPSAVLLNQFIFSRDKLTGFFELLQRCHGLYCYVNIPNNE